MKSIRGVFLEILYVSGIKQLFDGTTFLTNMWNMFKTVNPFSRSKNKNIMFEYSIR